MLKNRQILQLSACAALLSALMGVVFLLSESRNATRLDTEKQNRSEERQRLEAVDATARQDWEREVRELKSQLETATKEIQSHRKSLELLQTELNATRAEAKTFREQKWLTELRDQPPWKKLIEKNAELEGRLKKLEMPPKDKP